MKEQIIEKIKKLLALADGNTNENEAVAAALKAQKLMSEYDIKELDLLEKNEPLVPIELSGGKYRDVWRGWLAVTIADNFRCKSFIHKSFNHNSWTYEKEIIFLGHELDANAANLTYQKLAEIGERLVSQEKRKYKAKYGHCRGVKNTYLHGFVEGVRRELEKQCQALMLVCPTDVLQAFDDLNLRKGKKTYFSGFNASEAGENAGRDAVRSSRLDTGKTALLTA